MLFLLNRLLFITIHDESLSNHICCQFDVIWLFLLSDERVHKPFLKYIHCCSQMFKCFLFFLLCRFCIDIHSGLNILMPHDRLDNLQVGFSFTKPCAKSMSQIVCRKVRSQHRLSMLFSCFYFFRRIVGGVLSLK